MEKQSLETTTWVRCYYGGPNLGEQGLEKLRNGDPLLLGNAPVHRQAVQTEEQCGFEIPPHPVYSPDLAPLRLYSLSQSKNKILNGRHFHENEDTIEAVEDWLGTNSGSFFSQGLLKVNERW